MIILSIIYLLFVHYVADFIIQTDWQAKNKSKNNTALTRHIVSYTTVLFAGSLFFLFFYPGSFNLLFLFVIINGILHWVTDYFTSRVNSYLWGKGETKKFFIFLGFDQWVHSTILLLTFNYFFIK